METRMLFWIFALLSWTFMLLSWVMMFSAGNAIYPVISAMFAVIMVVAGAVAATDEPRRTPKSTEEIERETRKMVDYTLVLSVIPAICCTIAAIANLIVLLW